MISHTASLLQVVAAVGDLRAFVWSDPEREQAQLADKFRNSTSSVVRYSQAAFQSSFILSTRQQLIIQLIILEEKINQFQLKNAFHLTQLTCPICCWCTAVSKIKCLTPVEDKFTSFTCQVHQSQADFLCVSEETFLWLF